MTCPFWGDPTHNCAKGAAYCDCVTGQDENIVNFKPVYNPVYENKSRRWLPVVILIVCIAFWVWILI